MTQLKEIRKGVFVRPPSPVRCPYCGLCMKRASLRRHLVKFHEVDLRERVMRECYDETVDIIVGETPDVEKVF